MSDAMVSPRTAPMEDWSTYVRWLEEVTMLPTAAGREQRVVAWIQNWISERDHFLLDADRHGNLVISHVAAPTGVTPLYLTAHLDHPAFVVEESLPERQVRLSFRGGVRDPYFREAHVDIHTDEDQVVRVQLLEAGPADPFRKCRARVIDGDPARLAPGQVGVWSLPGLEYEGDIIRTAACDDLAAVVAALAAMEELHQRAEGHHVQVLFTRAEEVGFIGAIAACRDATMTPGARVVALENSRSFADSPIGGGPIVRVGDRISTFSPALTGAVAKVAEGLRTEAERAGVRFNWQRKLMPGGACEATVFQAYGYEATCVCLPLGNYHNMANLDEVTAGDDTLARVEREYISMSDFADLIRLLAALGTSLEQAEPITARLEKLFDQAGHVLEE